MSGAVRRQHPTLGILVVVPQHERHPRRATRLEPPQPSDPRKEVIVVGRLDEQEPFGGEQPALNGPEVGREADIVGHWAHQSSQTSRPLGRHWPEHFGERQSRGDRRQRIPRRRGRGSSARARGRRRTGCAYSCRSDPRSSGATVPRHRDLRPGAAAEEQAREEDDELPAARVASGRARLGYAGCSAEAGCAATTASFASRSSNWKAIIRRGRWQRGQVRRVRRPAACRKHPARPAAGTSRSTSAVDRAASRPER